MTRRQVTTYLTATSLLANPLIAAAQRLTSPRSGTLVTPPASPTDKLIVYQIFTRLFGNQKATNTPWGTLGENGVGKFNDITDKALQALKKLGISHVWYTGVIEHATMTGYSSVGIANDNPLVVKGRAGSPYAIKDYYDVDPDLAVDVRNRMAEFDALVKRSHANGLKVIIDFIPNHVARQYISDAKPDGVRDLGETDDTAKAFDPNNNFYYLPEQPFQVPAGGPLPPNIQPQPYEENPAKATGNDVFKAQPSVDDWYETIKLNYGVDIQDGRKPYFDPIPSTWLKMRDILLFWVAKGIDGFRCDMAEMVPVEFWGWVIPQVKAARQAQPTALPIVFIAEIYNPAQYRNYIETGKFDYLYDKVGLYDTVRKLMEGRGNTAEISTVLEGEAGKLGKHMLRFLENHDEQRIASRFFTGDPMVAIPAMTLSATLQTGPLMLYAGQELGVNPTQAEGFQGDDGRTTIFDYWGVPELQAWVNGGAFDGGRLTANQKSLRQFYQQLNQLVNTNDALRTGTFLDLRQYGPANTLYSFLRYSDKQKLLIVCNFDKKQAVKITITIPPEAWQSMKLAGAKARTYTDIFRQKAKFKGTDSVAVNVPALGVLVLSIG